MHARHFRMLYLIKNQKKYKKKWKKTTAISDKIDEQSSTSEVKDITKNCYCNVM